MTNTTGIGCIALLTASIAWSVTSRGQNETQATASPAVDKQMQTDDHTGLEIAARYHLRNRTNRFFQRGQGNSSRSPKAGTYQRLNAEPAPSNQIAARYHLRSRTTKFYQRVAC